MIGTKEYIILIILSILPILYKYLFWFFAIQLKEYRLDRFYDYIKTPQGTKAVLNFWFIIDIVLFILMFGILVHLKMESIFYYILISVLLFENIFVILKFLKKSILKPKRTGRFLFTILILAVIQTLLYFIIDNLYFFIIANFVFTPIFILFSIFLSYPVIYFLKQRKFKKAEEISRKYENIIKIGVTGSYGKTSQKEYINQFLKHKYKVLATPKNINTEVGVADVIIKKLTPEYDVFVAEMGAYKIGEIKTLGKIVGQKYGFITAIGNQHLALFGGLKNTMKAKSEIAIEVQKNKGILYINWDNKNVRELEFEKCLKIVKYGTKKGADARSEILEIEGGLTKFEFEYKKFKAKFKTNLIGTHNIINITGILALCVDLGFEKEELKEIIKNLKTPENTLELLYTNSNVVLNDTYNLSEGSLFAGLQTINSFKNTKEKILIIDDILELGKESKDIHFKIGKKIAKENLATKIVYVGVNYKKDFVEGLLEGGFGICDVYSDLLFVGKGDILLFEGRKAQTLLNNFLGKKLG